MKLYYASTIVLIRALIKNNVVIISLRSGRRSRCRNLSRTRSRFFHSFRRRARLRRFRRIRRRRGFRGHVHVDDPGSGRGRSLFLEYLPDLGLGEAPASARREDYEGGSRDRRQPEWLHHQRLSEGRSWFDKLTTNGFRATVGRHTARHCTLTDGGIHPHPFDGLRAGAPALSRERERGLRGWIPACAGMTVWVGGSTTEITEGAEGKGGRLLAEPGRIL